MGHPADAVRGSGVLAGLILVVIAGSELLTGNFALVPLAAFEGLMRELMAIDRLVKSFG